MPTITKPIKRIAILLNERQFEMLEDLMQKFGYSSYGEAFKAFIILAHKDAFKDYLQRPGMTTRDPIALAKQRVEISEAKKTEMKRLAFEEKRFICEEVLHGEAKGKKKDLDGAHCIYTVWNFDRPLEQTLPLRGVTDELAKNRFIPSKEKVIGLLREKGMTFDEETL